jgi:hypothetical protein
VVKSYLNAKSYYNRGDCLLPELSAEESDTSTTLLQRTKASLIPVLNAVKDGYYYFPIPGGPGAGLGVNSFSYTFNVAEPVPESATLSLLGAGITGLLARHRKRRQEESIRSCCASGRGSF